jgi:hypothetical protein
MKRFSVAAMLVAALMLLLSAQGVSAGEDASGEQRRAKGERTATAVRGDGRSPRSGLDDRADRGP